MSSSASDQRVIELLVLLLLADQVLTKANFITKAMSWFDKYLLILVIGGFFAGIGIASISQPMVDQVDSTINRFMGVCDYIAPIAIFLILTSSRPG